MLEIIRKTGERWTPTHVEQQINEGWASLFVCEDGFAVLKRQKQDWTSEPFIQVWALWFKPNTAKARRDELFAWVRKITREAGCRYAEMGSPLKGWGRVDELEFVRTVWRISVDGN